jgi:ABC-type branched-subunit amino acid transport system substrate-binding protein
VIGGLDSAGTRTSAPLFNEAGLLQVGVGAGYPGLTRPVRPDEPARYQPSAHTTFARVIGDDVQQASAIVSAASGDRKSWTLAIENEGDDDSQALAQAVEQAARAAGGRVVAEPRDADALVYAGSDPENAAGVADGWAREAPDARIVLPDAVVRAGVAERLSPAARRATRMVSSAPAEQSPEWRRFAADFRSRLGREPGPYAAVGYEAMRGVLTALDRAGSRSNQRQRVIDSYLSAPERASLLGPLKVDARGDRVAPRFTIERP